MTGIKGISADFDADILQHIPRRHYCVHATKLKLFINPILRKIQYKTNNPWVIASHFNNDMVFTHYSFQRVVYDKNVDKTAVSIAYLPIGKEIRTTLKYYWNKLIYG